MSALFNAVHTNSTETTNGCVAHSSTLNSCLDLFVQVGSSRGQIDKIIPIFLKSLGDDPKVTSQILFWLRDIRGGQGERDLFRSLVPFVANKENIERVIDLTLEVGRTDDLFVFVGTEFERNVLRRLTAELKAENPIVAKWIPRKKGIFNNLHRYMKVSPKELRQTLVRLSNTVEQKMSSDNWNEITYKHVPSRAAMIYTKAFGRNDTERYDEYKESLKKGEVKINASTLYPYDLVLKIKQNKFKDNDENVIYGAQWNALPNYLEENDFNILPVIDVSGSMDKRIPESKLTCMDVAVSLGLYVAERNDTIFKDQFITFHSNPSMVKVKGDLNNRLHTIYRSPWGGNTNIQKTFELILDAAVRNNLKQEDLPSHLLIFSDMQFDRIETGGWGYNGRTSDNKTAFDWAKNEFESKGYKLPNIVFWNLDSTSSYPVQDTSTGTSLVSGFNPSLLKSVLSGNLVEEPNPLEVMMETVDVERYTL